MSAPPKQHPTSLDELWSQRPEMWVLPLASWAGLLAVDCVWGEDLAAAGMQPWGAGAVEYTALAVLGSYAYHGYVCAHYEDLQKLKVQQDKAYHHACAGLAARSTAVLLTELVYTALPMSPALGHSAADWLRFALLFVLLKLFQDAWFFAVHYLVHSFRGLYAAVHKLHHTVHAPNCFGAYFVTYYSHFLVEQLPMTIAALAFRFPRDVLVFYLYVGAFGFFMDHGGIHMGEVELPFGGGVMLGHALSVLNFEGVLFQGVEVRTHDFHHERVSFNYALHYTYLDRLLGVFHDGRRAPEPPKMTSRPGNPTAACKSSAN